MRKTAVYEIVRHGRILYVGVAYNPVSRRKAHASRGAIPDGAEFRVVEWFDTREQALSAEASRIRRHNPPLNYQRPYGPRLKARLERLLAHRRVSRLDSHLKGIADVMSGLEAWCIERASELSGRV